MKCTCILLLSLFIPFISGSQSIFSVLHLNEEREVHKGIPMQITRSTIFYNTKGTETHKTITQYSRAGLPSLQMNFGEDGEITTVVHYKYDSAKRIILEKRIEEKNVRFYSNRPVTRYYYEKGALVKMQDMQPTGFIVSETIIKNDTAGLPIELQLFEPPGNLIGVELASYKPQNNLAIVSVANSQGKIISTDSMKISFKDGYQFPDSGVTYNNKQDIIASQTQWHNGTIHYSEYEYVYDAMENWTEEKAFDVIYLSNGKKKRNLKSDSQRQILYWAE